MSRETATQRDDNSPPPSPESSTSHRGGQTFPVWRPESKHCRLCGTRVLHGNYSILLCDVRRALDSMERIEYGCVPIRLYL